MQTKHQHSAKFNLQVNDTRFQSRTYQKSAPKSTLVSSCSHFMLMKVRQKLLKWSIKYLFYIFLLNVYILIVLDIIIEKMFQPCTHWPSSGVHCFGYLLVVVLFCTYNMNSFSFLLDQCILFTTWSNLLYICFFFL